MPSSAAQPEGRDRRAPAASDRGGSAPADELGAGAREPGVVDHDRGADPGEPGAHQTKHSARKRAHAAEARVDSAASRDAIANARDLAASARDHAAARRDRELATRGVGTVDVSHEGSAEDRRHESDRPAFADLDRLTALEHRTQNAADRAQAAADREQAACDRIQADLDRRELLHELVAAETDPLTGARTRTAGLADLADEIDRARRTGGLLMLAYIDVVGLKSVNDTFGHAAGDALLRRTADGIRSHLRAYDLIVRFGGDEFLCALAGATLRDAHARFAVIRADLAAAADPSEIKAGFAQLEPHESAAALIARADADLPVSVARDGPGERAGASAKALERSERHDDAAGVEAARCDGPGERAGASAKALERSERHDDAAGVEAARSSGGDGLPMNHPPHDSSGDSNARGAVTPMDPDGCTARHRVLVADDDPVVQSSLRMSLAAGFEVVGVASDSEQAIALAAATKPDAAIVDVNMPGGGLRAVQGIHDASPATAIVILSSDELSGVVRELLLAGATTYCRKGVAPEVLGELLTRSIRARAGEIAAQAAVGEPAAQV